MSIDSKPPYLSVVVTTRNDDHGGDPLKRLQALVDSFDAQCHRYQLEAELIVVEWNPPAERPSVASLLRLPPLGYCTYRFIEVPPEVHQTLKHADVLPLFQMIAKNVGIRRARGRFVLATNIDIILSAGLVQFLASRSLEERVLYRVDRHDIEADIPRDASLDVVLDYCASHQLRMHTRWGSYPVDSRGHKTIATGDVVDGRTVALGTGWHVRESAAPGTVFRWASDRVEFLLDQSGEPAGVPTELEVEVDVNPYQTGSSVHISAIEADRTLMTARVDGRVCLKIPLPPAVPGVVRRIELVVPEAANDDRHNLPAFELRSPMRYRIHSAQLKTPAAVKPLPFAYPHRWTNANDRSDLTVTPTGDGLLIVTDPRRFSYCVQFGPLKAAHQGTYQFQLNCTVLEGGVNLGLLSGDHQSWLPASVKQQQDWQQPSTRRFEITVDCAQGTSFWLVMTNDHPHGDGVSRVIVHDLTGSEDPGSVAAERGRLAAASALPGSGAPASGNPQVTRRSLRQRLRGRLSRTVDMLARATIARLPSGLRYRIVRVTAEFRAVEGALEQSDKQLRELAPLRHLMGFNAFLRDHRPDNLHVNGCGDFQLMARERWEDLRGYPEFETFSMNIDGLFSYVAGAAGVREQVLDMDIYHIEHEVGSGWSPEGEALLRRRIAERGITWLDASTIYVWAAYMKWLGQPMIFNRSNWGLADSTLPEIVHSAARRAASR
jgi:hypothetical protein